MYPHLYVVAASGRAFHELVLMHQLSYHMPYKCTVAPWISCLHYWTKGFVIV